MLPTIATGNVGSALAGEYEVANSLRFDDGSSDYLDRTPSSAGNRKTFTFATWFKLGSIDTTKYFISSYSASSDSGYTHFSVQNNNKLHFAGNTTDFRTSTQLLRDPSAWYHVVLAVDTTQATASDRIKIYLNGSQITDFTNNNNPNQNDDFAFNQNAIDMVVGSANAGGSKGAYWDGYLAETVWIDGTALDPTSFGEFDSDTGIWKPIDVSGLTFGNNGFYLDFENSGSLGADVSGNGNNFTVNNLTSVDQSSDSCTNNYCTMNPLDNYYASSTFAEGNLKITTNASNTTFNTGTIGLSTGKWYWEAKLVQAGGEESIGITDIVSTGTGIYGGKTANNYSFKGNNGDIRNNDSNSSYGSAYAEDSIISVFMDLDNNKLYFAIDGTLQNSGTGISITAPASTSTGFYFPMVGDVDSDSVIWECNFGSPTFAISSGNTDGEYGNFEYSTTITGDGASKTFKAINTKNLAEYG